MHRLLLVAVFFAVPLAAQETEATRVGRAIIAAPDDAARDRLVQANASVAPFELREAIIAEIRVLFNRANYPRALGMANYLETYSSRYADRTGMAHAHLFLGNVRTQMGEYDTAIAEYGQCVLLAKEAGYIFAEYAAATAVGNLEQIRGNYRESIVSHQAALQIAEANRNADWIAMVLLNLAVAYNEAGDNRRSLEFYERVRVLKAGDAEWEPYILGNLASMYYGQGDVALSLEYSKKAFAMMEASKLEREALSILNNIGEAQRSLGQYTQALATFRQTLGRGERMGVRKAVALARHNMGRIYESQGKPEPARISCQNSLQIRKEIGDQPGVVESLLCLCRLSMGARNFPAALAAAEAATRVARTTQSFWLLWEPLLLTGQARQGLHRPVEARASYEESIATIESLRDQLGGDERQKQQFFEDKVLPYKAVVDLLLAQNKTEEALQYAERARSRVLQDVFAKEHTRGVRLSAIEQEQEQRLARRLGDANRQLLKAAGDRVPALQLAVQESRNELQIFRDRLYLKHPELRYVRATNGPVSLAQIRELFANPRAAMLEFVIGERDSSLFVYTAGQLRAYPIAISRQTLNTRIREFRTRITSRSANYQALARSLYSTLLLPASRQLQGKTAICIVPDGDLWELPFQALIAPSGAFLIEELTVSYAPSLAVLRDMRLNRRAEVAPLPLLAIGNPTMGAAPRPTGTEKLRSSFEPLPETEAEVREVARQLGSARSTVLLRSRATESAFKRAAQRARVLHFATHGVLDKANPLHSYLVLAQDDERTGEDGLLEAWELMQLELQADLAVLSACETGRGVIRAGEGVIGLSWAFFVAGVPTTVVSQWKVESRSTARLMGPFYQQWANGQTVARALQAAARTMLKDDRYAHPFFWAPFVAIGNAQ